MTHNLGQLVDSVTKICKRADAEVIAPLRASQQQLTITAKDDSGRNFVTQADLQTENFLKSELSAILPEAGFIAEESSDGEAREGLQWIIDPIDGTTNFMHNMPPFCISVALADGTKVLLGVIFELFHKECFYAWEGGGAWLDGKPIRVSKTASISESLLVTGFPYEHGPLFDRWIMLFSDFTKASRGVRRLGAAAVDMAYVACGRFDAFYEYNLQPWDVAAGIVICSEAGGQITDFTGGNDYLFGKRMVCSNGHVHPSMLQALESFDH